MAHIELCGPMDTKSCNEQVTRQTIKKLIAEIAEMKVGGAVHHAITRTSKHGLYDEGFLTL